MPSKKIVHIDYAIPPQTHTSMYLMHKYWARKPHNVVREYIEHYSSEGDIVLDPFSGSGVTAIEALKAKRKAIATDLDPMSTFITKMTINPVNLEEFQKAFDRLKKNLQNKINSLYETICPKCGAHAFAQAAIWNENNLEEVRLSCKCSKKTLWKKPSRYDFQKLKEIEKTEISSWYPKNQLIWNTRVNVNKGETASDLFTKRNLIALSLIFNKINSIKDEKIKELMHFTFTSTLGQASKMVFVIRNRGRAKGEQTKSKPEVGSWATRGYWVPPEHFEINAWNCFEERFHKVYRGKTESNDELPNPSEAANFEELTKNKDYLIRTWDALELSSLIPDESIDYVFTDPPYGDSVPYLELDYLWSSWLGFKPDFGSEIIISDSPERKEKNFEMYGKMLSAAFREIYRVLKRGKYLTVTFHNTDIQIYNLIISTIVLAGFDLEKIIYQPPARTSPKGLLAPYGSAVGDYYIRYKKPETERSTLNNGEIDKERYERIVVDSIKHIIAKRGEATPYSIIVNNYSSIYEKLKDNGFLFSAPQTVEQILKKQLNKEFVLKDNKWWFKDPSVVPYIEQVPLNERVENVTLNVLNRKIKVTFDDVLREVFTLFTNAMIPDIQSVRDVLSELAVQTKDGKWMLKPNIKRRLSEHDSIVEIIAKIGELAGYTVYADTSNYRVKLNLPSLPPQNVDRIQEIDALWISSGEIAYEFEVENTTGITEAIVRGSNIPSANVKRYIVIPEERQSFFYQKISEPMIREKIEKLKWGFIFYDSLVTFYEQNKKKKKIDISDFEKVCSVPKLKTQKQPTIQEFKEGKSKIPKQVDYV
jgi:DNA modification methylase